MVGLIKRMVGLLGFGVLISIHCAACFQNIIIIGSKEPNTDYIEITPDYFSVCYCRNSKSIS